MFPGMNPKQMQQAMKQLGIKQQELDAIEVIIKLHDKELVINAPSVQKITMHGQDSFQISGEVEERDVDSSPEITDDDLETVMDQTGCTREEAEDAIIKANGDLAEAILNISEKED
ncbi:MAG: nascent polypeptide-associated complex protein [Candidatus Nanoarchaeia archaeon]